MNEKILIISWKATKEDPCQKTSCWRVEDEHQEAVLSEPSEYYTTQTAEASPFACPLEKDAKHSAFLERHGLIPSWIE